jgi:hypothetical protein
MHTLAPFGENAVFLPDVQRKGVPSFSHVRLGHVSLPPVRKLRRGTDVLMSFGGNYAGGTRSRRNVNGYHHGCGWQSDGGCGVKCGIRA